MRTHFSSFYPTIEEPGQRGTSTLALNRERVETILDELDVIVDDSILTADEKTRVLIPLHDELDLLYDALTGQAFNLGLSGTAEYSSAVAANSAWVSYLNGLSPDWDDETQSTTIVRENFRTYLNGFIDSLNALQVTITNEAARTADVDGGLTDGGTPISRGDVITSEGTSNDTSNVSGRPSSTVLSQVDVLRGRYSDTAGTPGNVADVAATALPIVNNPEGSQRFGIRVTWTARPAGENIDVYVVEIAEASGGPYFPYITANAEYTFTGLKGNTIYYFRVKAKNAAGNLSSAYSSPVVNVSTGRDNVAPPQITDLNAVASVRSVFLTWTNPSGIDDLKTVNIYESKNNTSFSASSKVGEVPAIAGTVGSWTRTGIQRNGDVYSYWVKAVDTSLNEASSQSNRQDIQADAIATEDFIVNTLSGDIINVDTLNANRIKSATALPATLTLGPTGFDLSQVQTVVEDPAAAVNANTTLIGPGRIQLTGAATLSHWQLGSDLTSINGGRIGANTVAANALYIGLRGITMEGMEFEHNKPSTNSISWTAGSISYKNDSNTSTTQAITAGSAAWVSGTLYIYWVKGASTLSTTTSYNTASGTDNILIAAYRGGTDVVATYGRTIVDGSDIKANTVNANRLIVGSLTGQELWASATMAVGAGENVGGLTGIGSVRLWAGSADPVSAPFRVDQEGKITARNLELLLEDGTTFFDPSIPGGWTEAALTSLFRNAATRTAVVSQGVENSTSSVSIDGSVFPVVLDATSDVTLEINYPINLLRKSNTGTAPAYPGIVPPSITFKVYERYKPEGGPWGSWVEKLSRTYTRITAGTPTSTEYRRVRVEELIYDAGGEPGASNIYRRTEYVDTPTTLTHSVLLTGNAPGDYEYIVEGPRGGSYATLSAQTTTVTLTDDNGADFLLGGVGSAGSGGSAGTFLYLADTPSAYSGAANYVVRVNSTTNALEFFNPANLPVNYGSLVGVPSSFTPSAHVHDASDVISGTLADARIPSLAISKITGLQTALDGKLSTAGGTLSGNLSISKSAGQPYVDIVRSGTLGTDYPEIRLRTSSRYDRIRNTPDGMVFGYNYSGTVKDMVWDGSSLSLNGADVWTDATFDPNTKANVSHTHAASDITSGVFDLARIPFAGLNSDMVDGYHASTSRTASTVVVRNGSGDIYVQDVFAHRGNVTGALYLGDQSGGGRGIYSDGSYYYFLGVGAYATSFSSGSYYASGVDPYLELYETDVAADNRLWRLHASGGQLKGYLINDAYSTYTQWLNVARSGTTVTDVTLTGSNITLFTTNQVQFCGSLYSYLGGGGVGSYIGNGLYYNGGWRHTAASAYGWVMRQSGINGLELIIASDAGTQDGAATTNHWNFFTNGDVYMPGSATFGGTTILLSSNGASRGFVRLTAGNAWNTGYVEFYTKDGVRTGYMGYADASWIYLNGENGRLFRFGQQVNFDGPVYVSGSAPTIFLEETDAGADAKLWRWAASGGGLRLETINDAYSAAATIMEFSRSGATPTGVNFLLPLVRFGAGGVGFIYAMAGTSTSPGYHSFHTQEGTRRGYIGWSDGYYLTITGENGWGWAFNGGVMPKFMDGLNNVGSLVMSSGDPYIRTDVNTKHLVVAGGPGGTDQGAVIVLRGRYSVSNDGGMEITGADSGTRNLLISGFAGGQYINGQQIWASGRIPTDIWQNDLNGYSRFHFVSSGATYITAPSNVIIMKDAAYGYDAFRFDMASGASRMVMRGVAPSIFLRDTDAEYGAALYVNSNYCYLLRLPNDGTSTGWDSGPNGRHPMTVNLSTGQAVFSTGAGTTSDRLLKDDQGVFDGDWAIGAMAQLAPRRYSWKGQSQAYLGFYAQEVLEVLPSAVTKGPDGFYSLTYDQPFMVAFAALKRLIEKVEAYAYANDNRWAALEARLAKAGV